MFASGVFSQSVIDYQPGSAIDIQAGADVCAQQISINGTFTGGGTFCGGAAYVLNLTAYIQGFYNASTGLSVMDTVTVYLRSVTAPYAKAESAKSTLSPSGTGIFIFSNAVNVTDYYIVLKHRNSIETWSSAGIMFTANSAVYNFTASAGQAFGSNMIMTDTSPVRFGIYGGDVDQDGATDVSDIINIFNDVNNFLTGYIQTDVTGDNFADATDLVIAYNNSINFVSVVSP